MTQAEVLDVFREALLVATKLAAPILIASIVVGLIVAIFQAATQIHEQTLTFVPGNRTADGGTGFLDAGTDQ